MQKIRDNIFYFMKKSNDYDKARKQIIDILSNSIHEHINQDLSVDIFSEFLIKVITKSNIKNHEMSKEIDNYNETN